jgi:hypothetical protein
MLVMDRVIMAIFASVVLVVCWAMFFRALK